MPELSTTATKYRTRFGLAVIVSMLGVTACSSSSSGAKKSSSPATGGSSASSPATGSSTGTGSSSTATSTDTASGSDPVAAMTAAVDKARQPSNTFVAPGASLDAKAYKGASVWYVSLSQSIPVLAIEQNGIKQAADALGMTFHVCDGKFQPALAAGCINAAVSAGAKGIVTDSVTLPSVSTAVTNAAQHKVPIVAMAAIGTNSKDVAFITNGDEMSEAIAAQWIIADSKGKAQVLMSSVQDDTGARNDISSGSAPQFAKCSGCKTVIASYTSATVPSVPSIVSSTLLSHRTLDYGLPQFDFLVPLFKSGVQTAGFTAKMKVVSTNAVLSSMQLVKSGGQAADIGSNRNYSGWVAMDSLLRLLKGMPVPTVSSVPQRVFDSKNIASIPLTDAAAGTGEWFGPLTYQKDFQKLWGA